MPSLVSILSILTIALVSDRVHRTWYEEAGSNHCQNQQELRHDHCWMLPNYSIIRLRLLKIATGTLRSLWAEIASNKDQYFNKASSDMSKSISQIKSLHDHVITVILTPANGECTPWKH